MAPLADIPIKYYNGETDEYRLPNGRVVPGQDVTDAKRERRNRIDAARAYDPYNHIGRSI